MTTFLGFPKSPKMCPVANPILTSQGIDFTQKCHYTLAVYICEHKQYRKPRVTHVGSCVYLRGTHKKTQCQNFVKTPKVVDVAELCPKCAPKFTGEDGESWKVEGTLDHDREGLEKDIDKPSLSVEKEVWEDANAETSEILEATAESERVGEWRRLVEDSIDDQRVSDELVLDDPQSWTQVEEGMPSVGNGKLPIKSSLLARVYRAFSQHSKRNDQDQADVEIAGEGNYLTRGPKRIVLDEDGEENVRKDWVEVKQDLDW